MHRFFDKLAERLNSENNLSDITWALCSSNDVFQDIFLVYCFEKSIKNDINDIEREIKIDNKKPDFLIIDNKGIEYLLEVKIYDKNLHDNYKEIKIPKNRRAIITNYKITENNDTFEYKKTWHGLIEYIEKQNDKINGINSQIIKGYLDYLKSVTNYFKGGDMNLSNLHSLHIFLGTIKQIIETSGIDNVKPKYSGNEEYSGFKFKFKKSNRDFHIWFGVTFGDNETYICIEFFDECSKKVKDTLLAETIKGKYFQKPHYSEDSSILVGIDKNILKKICDNVPYEEQKNLLEKYFKEVMDLF